MLYVFYLHIVHMCLYMYVCAHVDVAILIFCCCCCCSLIFIVIARRGVAYLTHCEVRALPPSCCFTKFMPLLLLLFFIAMLALPNRIRGSHRCSYSRSRRRCKFKRCQNYHAFDTFTLLMCRYTITSDI